MTESPHIVSILLRYSREEKLTAGERTILAAWLEESAANQRLFDEISDPERWKARVSALQSKDDQATWMLIENRISTLGGFTESKDDTVSGISSVWSAGWWKYAAAAIAVIVLVVLLEMMLKKPLGGSAVREVAQITPDIITGSKHTVFTRASGRTFVLDSAGVSSLRSESFGAGPVSTDSLSLFQSGYAESSTLAKLEVPQGSMFRIVLSDGTAVWVNSASTLTFPEHFSGVKERFVGLSGEAYFEVAKDAAHPFVVETGQGRVRVLGTHFNVNSFDGFKTVLLEGSVRIDAGHDSAVLKPGDQGIFSDSGPLSVSRTDTARATAWRHNNFWFQDADYPAIMKELSHWYPMTVSFDGDIKNHFSGILPRDKSLRKLLTILEGGGHVAFQIQGTHVTVKALL